MPIPSHFRASILVMICLIAAPLCRGADDDTPPEGTKVVRAEIEDASRTPPNEEDLRKLLEACEGVEKVRLARKDDQFEALLFAKGDPVELEESVTPALKKALKDVGAKLGRIEVREYRKGGTLKPPQIESDELVKLAGKDFFAKDREWMVRVTTTSQGRDTITFERHLVKAVKGNECTVSVELLDGEFKQTSTKELTLPRNPPKLPGEWEDATLETVFGSLKCEKSATEGSSNMPGIGGSAGQKQSTFKGLWKLKANSFMLRYESRTETGVAGSDKPIVDGTLREVIEVSR